MRPDRHRHAGFTLFELLIAMLSAAVLALTAAVMLVAGFETWQANGDAVLTQQEGTLAMDLVSRSLRAAAAANVVVAPGQVTIGPVSITVSGAIIDLQLVDTETVTKMTTAVAFRN